MRHEFIRSVSASLWGPLDYFLDPNQRLYWPYLLGALLLAIAAGKHSSLWSLAAWPFRRCVWLHRSTFLDLKLMFFKAPLMTLLFVPVAKSTFFLALWLVKQLDVISSVPERNMLSDNTIRILYTVVLFLCWDLSRFLLHSLAHRVPMLWELHKVHHSAKVMTPFTIYRSHPIETILFLLREVLVTASVTALFYYFFRSHALQYEFVGVNVIGFVLNVLGGHLRHSHVRLRYPAWLEHVLISPAQHQIHHSDDPSLLHHNCGAWLAIWDWMRGTLILSRAAHPSRFGLPPSELNHSPHGLFSAVLHPVIACVRRLVLP
jgi:sterol desaturase/sphingolipid hydroxylase (fatty acid hydroxylase superfamily)